jgi:hypothetical protein
MFVPCVNRIIMVISLFSVTGMCGGRHQPFSRQRGAPTAMVAMGAPQKRHPVVPDLV